MTNTEYLFMHLLGIYVHEDFAGEMSKVLICFYVCVSTGTHCTCEVRGQLFGVDSLFHRREVEAVFEGILGYLRSYPAKLGVVSRICDPQHLGGKGMRITKGLWPS